MDFLTTAILVGALRSSILSLVFMGWCVSQVLKRPHPEGPGVVWQMSMVDSNGPDPVGTLVSFLREGWEPYAATNYISSPGVLSNLTHLRKPLPLEDLEALEAQALSRGVPPSSVICPISQVKK